MSKRNSSTPSNTLFNYFAKTPPTNKKLKSTEQDESPSQLINNENSLKIENKKRDRQPNESPRVCSDSDDAIPVSTKKRKRIRLNPVDSDDSDTENKVDNLETPKEKVSFEKKLHDSFKYEANQSPKSSKTPSEKQKPTPIAKKTLPEETSESATTKADDGDWTHCKLEFLKPDKIRDANKRRPDHPDYDPTTLFVPPDFYKNQTPAHRQWWEMKSSHYDCVLFFKVGKFYELYHMDAAVGVNELGFSYMKGEFAHSGFPESAYSRMASTLVAKGYKVARVEQTETPDMMQERCKAAGQTSKSSKVVRREICQVTTRGTQICGLQDFGPSQPEAAYLICITEEEKESHSCYGVCLIDTSIGQFHLGQFEDDKHSSRLLTTLAHYPPALVVHDRKSTTARTSQLIATHCHNARRERIQIWPPEKTLKVLSEKYYSTNSDGDWPEGLKPFLHEGDALGLTPAKDCYLAIKALGGCVAYLTDCLLDIQILGMSQFTAYAPPDVQTSTLSQGDITENRWIGGNTLVLDAITLRNLRIVKDEGCLYDKLNFCSTAFGKRLLHQWVCAPSCSLKVIKDRQKVVKSLFENQALCQEAQSVLTTLPDLERLLAKVHALGNLKRSKDHPDSRAIFYEDKIYSKRKVLDFISVLNGFTAALKFKNMFSEVESELLKTVTQFAPDGKFPDYRDTLTFFKESFNQEEAQKEGRILPGAGVDPEYDGTLRMIQDIEMELKDYLKEQEKYFKCRRKTILFWIRRNEETGGDLTPHHRHLYQRATTAEQDGAIVAAHSANPFHSTALSAADYNLTYVGSDKKRFQIEVPESAASKAGSKYHMESARKGYKRFSTAETKEFLSRMMSAEEQKTIVLRDLSRRIFEKFSSHYNQWEAAVQCVAILDVLLAFAEFARQQSGDVCLPDVVFNQDKPFIQIKEGRHPCIPIAEDFIPNDTELGVAGPNLLILTGPNMGGKSTLMRQVGLLTVLAHLGSYLPAEECKLSLVDRIFTRLGASDDILAGQSTFLVEMMETAAIVKHATRHSVVLLDELGRGTSTYDGTAIASSVCVELANRECRVIFSTHYHSLVRHLSDHPKLKLGHMACMVETEESAADNDDDIPEETITFLYKLTPGACPKSYGFNAARLAGVPREIIRRGQLVSRKLEKEAATVRAFRDIMKIKNPIDLRTLLSSLTI